MENATPSKSERLVRTVLKAADREMNSNRTDRTTATNSPACGIIASLAALAAFAHVACSSSKLFSRKRV